MAHHTHLGSLSAALLRHARMVEEILTEYKQAEITQEQALGLLDEQNTILLQHIRSAFLVRLHNLQAFRVERGQTVLDVVPDERGRG